VIREVEAETTAFIVLSHYGLKGKSPEYLALYEVKEQDILSSLGRSVEAASRIINEIEKTKGGKK